MHSSPWFSGGHGARDLTTGGNTAGERRTALQHNTTHTWIAGQPRSRACSTGRLTQQHRTLTDKRTQRSSTTTHPASTQLQCIQLRTGLMLSTESGVKRRSNISWTLGHNLLSYGFVTLLAQLQSRAPRIPRLYFTKTCPTLALTKF